MAKVLLSSDIGLTFNPLPEAMAQDLVLSLLRKKLIDGDGNIVTDGDDSSSQVELLDTIMNMVQDILLEEGVVEVTLPRGKKWLRGLLRKSYVKETLSKADIDNAEKDPELQKFLYIRYIAIQDVSDYNVILNNTLLASDTSAIIEAEAS